MNDLAIKDLLRSRDARGTSTASGCNTRPRSPLVELEGKDRHTEVSVEDGGFKEDQAGEPWSSRMTTYTFTGVALKLPLNLEP